VGVNAANVGTTPTLDAAEVVWHDLECGDYTADLPAWRELALAAASPPGSAPILDIGAGTGRVALDLAREGHEVTAVDVSGRLLAALTRRAAGLRVRAVRADARELDLDRRDHALCIVPMQTLQLFGPPGRRAFLAAVRDHLRPGGVLACALLGAPEPFDAGRGDRLPSAESVSIDGMLYTSQACVVRVLRSKVVIERERSILAADGRALATGPAVFELDQLSPAELSGEARAAGFEAEESIAVPATADHVSATIAVLHA
jgi:SAM-dependent methyltransferase